MVREISPFVFDLGYTWWREMLNMGSRGRSNTFKLFGFGFLSLLMDLVLELSLIEDPMGFLEHPKKLGEGSTSL
jgi:hypothetical protein